MRAVERKARQDIEAATAGILSKLPTEVADPVAEAVAAMDHVAHHEGKSEVGE
jgi:hypothetical protein